MFPHGLVSTTPAASTKGVCPLIFLQTNGFLPFQVLESTFWPGLNSCLMGWSLAIPMGSTKRSSFYTKGSLPSFFLLTYRSSLSWAPGSSAWNYKRRSTGAAERCQLPTPWPTLGSFLLHLTLTSQTQPRTALHHPSWSFLAAWSWQPCTSPTARKDELKQHGAESFAWPQLGLVCKTAKRKAFFQVHLIGSFS